MADPPQEAYITAAWTNPSDVPGIFTVGDGSMTTANGVMYENVGLSSGTDYAYIIRFEIKSDTSDEVGISYAYIGSIVPVLIMHCPQPHVFNTEFQYFETDPNQPSNAAAVGVSVTMVILVVIAVAIGFVILYIWLR